MSFYKSFVRPLLFLFSPETVHNFSMALISKGIVKGKTFADPILEQQIFGVRFKNPLGLAAGFDKNADALEYWEEFGFGHAEVGTVTPRSQRGNPKPRLFRLAKDHALINRMGFNNDGARTIGHRLAGSRATIPIGVNMGKGLDTPLEQAAGDYREVFKQLRGFGAYAVVNVSSPNTPGLRSLQDRAPLLEILGAIRELDAQKPLFIKVSPDLAPEALDEVVEVALEGGATGLIATNTTLLRTSLRQDPHETGGLSGAPIRQLSNDVLKHLYRRAGDKLILIGVGGIFDGQDLFDKIASGAHLCQVYTGWIYEGPSMAANALEQLVGLMKVNRISSLEELRGSKAH
jgi:dihydroorotate dehydrogenase